MSELVRTRVWDLPTRLFHWLLVLTVTGSVVTAKMGEMTWHMRLGYVAATLLLFRLLWGLAGGRWSRVASMAGTLGSIGRYLRGQLAPAQVPGHNPLGVLSIVAVVALLLGQVATGLVADDEIATTGPLYPLVSSATSLAATAWHKQWGEWLLYGWLALHLGAIAWSAWRGQALLAAMWGGDKWLPPGTPASSDGLARRALALVLLALAAGLVTWLVGLGSGSGLGG